jgi:hypothetical protein
VLMTKLGFNSSVKFYIYVLVIHSDKSYPDLNSTTLGIVKIVISVHKD